jgi:hypothetical protein
LRNPNASTQASTSAWASSARCSGPAAADIARQQGRRPGLAIAAAPHAAFAQLAKGYGDVVGRGLHDARKNIA